jgi:hypothetical protein
MRAHACAVLAGCSPAPQVPELITVVSFIGTRLLITPSTCSVPRSWLLWLCLKVWDWLAQSPGWVDPRRLAP